MNECRRSACVCVYGRQFTKIRYIFIMGNSKGIRGTLMKKMFCIKYRRKGSRDNIISFCIFYHAVHRAGL